MAENILKLKVDSSEYEGKIRRAAEGLRSYADRCRQVGGTLEVVEKDTLDFVKSIGQMETVSRSAKGKLNEMTTAFTDLKMQYNQMTNAEKQSPFGRELAKSLDQLKTRINQTKTDLQSVQAELGGGGVGGKMGGLFGGGSLTGGFGDLTSALSQVGGQMGINTTLVSGLTAGTLGLGAAVAAVAAAEYEAAQAFKAYNEELARQDQITSVTTGLNGTEADNMTAAARSIAKVYGVDFREVINAANTLMTQFGRSGDEAISLIRDGMQGMIMGDGPKMLNMIQQFAPAFQSAGVSASQLVAVIQNSEGGIFTDQNMQAIVMALPKIKTMSENTAAALKGIGIDGKQMSQDIESGSITVFQALQTISKAIDDNKDKTKQTAAVMQDLFGRQARTAGDNLGRAIAELNTNLDETKVKTGALGESYRKLEQANEDLERAMQKTFQVKGWEEMSNFFETVFIKSIASILDVIGDINHAIDNVGSTFEEVFGFGGGAIQAIVDLNVALRTGPLGTLKEIIKYTKMLTGAGREDVRKQNINEIADTYKKQFDEAENKTVAYNEIHAKILRAANREYNKNGKSDNYERLKEILQIVDDYMMDNLSGLGNQTKAIITPKKNNGGKEITDDFVEINGLIAQAQERVSDLQKRIKEAPDETTISVLKQQLIEAQNELTRLNNIGNVTETTALPPLRQMEETIKQLNAELKNAETPEAYQEILSDIQAINEEIDAFTGKSNKKKSGKKNEEKSFEKEYSKIVGGVSSIASGIQQMGVEMPKELQNILGVLTGISSIMSGITALLTLIQIDTKATAIASATDALIPFARGGIVPHAAGGYIIPGNDYSDRTPILAQSGEIILNRAQQGVLANQLQGGGLGGMHIVGELQGEKIILVANRTFKRKGQGEIVTWK